MDEYNVDLIAVDPQQRPEAMTVYRIVAGSRMEAGVLARAQLAEPERWKVLDAKLQPRRSMTGAG